MDPSFQNPQLYDEPQSPQELDPKDIAIKNSSTGKGGKSENLSIQQQESISQDGQGRGQNLRPKDGADNSSITLHSIDMKGGLEPPQVNYDVAFYDVYLERFCRVSISMCFYLFILKLCRLDMVWGISVDMSSLIVLCE